MKNKPNSELGLFEQAIRRVWDPDEEKWYFSVSDVVGVLTDSKDPKAYWRQMKKREGHISEVVKGYRLVAADGKRRVEDCAHAEGVLRIIQSVPSPKAEPFKRWLAEVGYQRLEEVQNPELAIDRLREEYRLKGYSDEWIDKRIQSKIVRDELTGKGTHTFQQLWHLPGPYRVSGSKENLLEVDCGDGVAAGIQLLTAADDTIEFVCGDRQRLWSWESPRYGTILPRRSVVLEWTAAVPTTRVAAFFPMRELEAHGLPVRHAEMNRLSIWSGLFDLEFETDSIRCERKDAPCETTSCPSSSR